MRASSFTLVATPMIVLLACPTTATAQGLDRMHLELPAMELTAALRFVARKSHHQLIADSVAVRGKVSSPLQGDFTLDEAVERLIRGQGLSFEIKNGSILVRADPGATLTVWS